MDFSVEGILPAYLITTFLSDKIHNNKLFEIWDEHMKTKQLDSEEVLSDEDLISNTKGGDAKLKKKKKKCSII